MIYVADPKYSGWRHSCCFCCC